MARGGVNPENPFGLTFKEEEFCRQFITNGYNAKQAYIAAYDCHNKGTLSTAPSKVMRREHIQKYIQYLQKERLAMLGVTAERVLEELAGIAFSDKKDEYIGCGNKLKAIDLMQKQMGIQKQNIKAEVEQTQEIHVTIEE